MATARAVRRPPTRSCVACRTSRVKRELLRVVRTPAGGVAVDPTGRLNGRGAYVCAAEACIVNGIERGTLARALETPVPSALAAELRAALNQTDDRRGGTSGQE